MCSIAGFGRQFGSSPGLAVREFYRILPGVPISTCIHSSVVQARRYRYGFGSVEGSKDDESCRDLPKLKVALKQRSHVVPVNLMRPSVKGNRT
jgi:hypothetical protein